MRNELTLFSSPAFGRFLRTTPLAWSLPAIVLLLGIQPCRAGSATWDLTPTDNAWHTSLNWTPPTVPNGPADIATFDVSNTTDVHETGTFIEVDSLVFNAGASAFTITFDTARLYIGGAGIVNNSGKPQNFVSTGTISEFGLIDFSNSATAGSGNLFTAIANGLVIFENSSNAGNGCTFTNNGGIIDFRGFSSADDATLIANGGGWINFGSRCKGGTARVELFDTSRLDISARSAPGLTIGSLEGEGNVFLGARTLTVGSNGLSTTFSGVLQDGGTAGGINPQGSLAKIKTGQLVLSGANTYSRGTVISGGKLLINNTSGSGTGSGAVQVNAGTLGGRGTIAGAVTVGKGSGPGAILSPASGAQPGTLTIQSPLLFKADASYNLKVDSNKNLANKVTALGVTINNGAQFVFSDFGNKTLPQGTVFTVLGNTAATPIVGTFSNLAEGSTFTSNGNTYKVSYEGGTGNDLTLTVQ